MDRRLIDDNSFNEGPPGAENDSFDLYNKGPTSPVSKRKTPPEKETKTTRRSKSNSRTRDRKSRSRSRGNRRRRSGSRDRGTARFSGRDKRRSRSRGNNRRSPDRNVRNRSRDRFRRNNRRNSPSPNRKRRDWSPKNGPRSPQNNQPNVPPPPIVSQQPPYGQSYDGYNYPGNVQYGNQQTGYAYDYNQAPPPPSFAPTYHPPPPVLNINQPIPPGDDFAPPPAAWGPPPVPMMSVPPPQPIPTEEDKIKRDAAIAQEVQNQRAELRKQREDYRRRASAMKREIKTLKDQRGDLYSGSAPPSPTTRSFLKENDRLQTQIQNKLNTIENVIDMLSGIIGKDSVEKSPPPPPVVKPKKKESPKSNDSSPEHLKSKLMESLNKKRNDSVKSEKEFKLDDVKIDQIEVEDKVETKDKKTDKQKKINYVHYDPEMHWCQTCDVFPKTAKDYLTHLHSKEHQDRVATPESPWHEIPFNDEMPTFANAPTKRTPIRGLQFFMPSTAWYCKMCSLWMGDLHCASLHLKSQLHAEKYNVFIEQNPHFEVDWMADRQKAYEKVRENPIVAPPPPSLGATPSIDLDIQKFHGIPLQINQSSSKVVNDSMDLKEKEDKKSKKKKGKKSHDDKKDKKKKKKSKKKRRDSSSSSSSSSDSSDSDSDKNIRLIDDTMDKSNSIRVAMRNLLKNQSAKEPQKPEIGGKWTVIQPPTKHSSTSHQTSLNTNISQETRDLRKKEDLVLSQWVTPEPIISASEKKMLDDLKGKLKKRTGVFEREENNSAARRGLDKDKITNRDKEKDRRKEDESRDRVVRDRNDRSRDREFNQRKIVGRDGGGNRRRSRSRSRSRGRRSRSPIRRYNRRRRSYSRSRSRSRIIEKPIVNFPPEFKPRPDRRAKIKADNDDERKRSPAVKRVPTQQTGPGGKKLPFIGRMPVFKKQTEALNDENKNEDELMDDSHVAPGEVPVNYPMMEGPDGMPNMMMEDDDDLMPDPAELMALMANTAPPPPPMLPMPEMEKEDVLPPGIDKADEHLVPKPLNDAPPPRKGPLPKDFQDALNLLFPGERRPGDVAAEVKPVEEEIKDLSSVTTEQPMIIADDLSQQSLDVYGAYAAPYANAPTSNVYSGNEIVQNDLNPFESSETVVDEVVVTEVKIPDVEEVKDEHKDELDDLALLGIDADDLAAQFL